jgi:hypothetical protein
MAGQSRLGYSLDEIKTEFPAYKQTVYLEVNITKIDTIITYFVKFDDGVVAYICKKNVCLITLIRPTTLECMNELIKKYDIMYTKYSESRWRANLLNETNYIKLMYNNETNDYGFIWTFIELE